MAYYGIDCEGPLPEGETNDSVHVRDTLCPLESPADIEGLLAIDPLRETDNYGIDIFIETKEYVYSKLNAQVRS